MKELRIYNLQISNGISEKLFIAKYGQPLFDKLRAEAFAIDRGACAGCGHVPPEQKKESCLYFHIYEENEKNPELTKGVTLCKMCHLTQHISSAIKNKWVIIVNSTHDQAHLNRLFRMHRLHGALSERSIIPLKKHPEQFLEEWSSRKSKPTTSIKVIFVNTFPLNDLE